MSFLAFTVHSPVSALAGKRILEYVTGNYEIKRVSVFLRMSQSWIRWLPGTLAFRSSMDHLDCHVRDRSGTGVGQEWVMWGTGVGQKWVMWGTGVGQKWVRCGTGVGQEWDRWGTGVGQEWDRSGSGVGQEKDRRWTEDGQERDRRGTGAGLSLWCLSGCVCLLIVW